MTQPLRLTKREMIATILRELKASATMNNRFFDAGDMFFTLAFREVPELISILAACRIQAVHAPDEEELRLKY